MRGLLGWDVRTRAVKRAGLTHAKNEGRNENQNPPKLPFPDSPEFYKLLLIFVVMVFLLVAVAMPLLYTLPSPPPKLS